MVANIIASGNSLRGMDLNEIEGYKIVLNHVYKYVDGYDALVAYDDPKLFGFPVEKLHTLDYHEIGTGWIEGTPHGMDRRPGHVMQLNSSLFMAINIALQKGFKDIFIWGADMELIDGYVHFYDEEPADEKLVAHYERRFKKNKLELEIVEKSLRSDENLIFVKRHGDYRENDGV